MRTAWATPPWGLASSQVLEVLRCGPTGLDPAEAARRLAEGGPNVVAILAAYILAAEVAKRRYYHRAPASRNAALRSPPQP